MQADTCGTLAFAAQRLEESGATKVIALVTHGILSGTALKRITESSIEQLVVTSTVPQDGRMEECPKLASIDVSQVLAETVRRSHYGESVSTLFHEVPLEMESGGVIAATAGNGNGSGNGHGHGTSMGRTGSSILPAINGLVNGVMKSHHPSQENLGGL